MPPVLLVAAGGAAGAASRYLLGTWLADRAGPRFPWSTLAINVAGCLAAGFLLSLMEARMPEDRTLRPLLVVGFLGGFTTFSAFGWETFALIRGGDVVRAASYVGASLVLGLVAVVVGAWAGRSV